MSIFTIFLEIASMERLTIKERRESGRNQYIAKCRKEGIKMVRPDNQKPTGGGPAAGTAAPGRCEVTHEGLG